MHSIDPARIQALNQAEPGQGPVLYWMSREQRIQDNWALLLAQNLALEAGQGLAVMFCLQPSFLGATWRQYEFMLQGLRETCRQALELHIPFVLRLGEPQEVVPNVISQLQASSLVCDFDPLRIKAEWRSQVAQRIQIPMHLVDAHNIVPCWQVSNKQEYAARTIRPKIQSQLPRFLQPFPEPIKHPYHVSGLELGPPDWGQAKSSLHMDSSVAAVSWLRPGPEAGLEMLQAFMRSRLEMYEQKSRDPNVRAQSDLSPYLHFGQLGPQRAAWEVWQQPGISTQAKQAFLEQLIIRRELADNFCWQNPDYDNLQGLPAWARQTLSKHREDPRAYLYSLQQLQAGQTHDQLWNAAQWEMLATGKMHGYMRMYWAKKILEWTRDPEQALDFGIYLNDRFELDGRDPNGYTGLLWAIGGLHDQGFKERGIFGKIRYMSQAGCRRKFNVRAYIQAHLDLRQDEL
ncbi:MAG: deoxyribodipyrimidine photo-lyase [Desulfohalobiaceae bacterium]